MCILWALTFKTNSSGGLEIFVLKMLLRKPGVDGRVKGKEVWGSSATFADIDNDGDVDLFVSNMAAPNLLYVNQGDGTFLEQSEARNVAYFGATKSANFCDYDRDGDLDMYLLTYQDFVSPGAEAFETVNGVKRVKEEHKEYHCLIAGRPAYAGEKDIFYRNDGNGVFTDVTEEVGIDGYDRGLACVWCDFDGDGWQDIYVGSDFKKPDHLYHNNQDGTFTDILPEVAQHTPWFSMGLDTGDLNNDGLFDLLVVDMASTTHYKQKLNMGGMDNSNWFLSQGEPRQYMKNAMFINTGAGVFMEAASLAGISSSNWSWAARLVDLDSDGWQDVFCYQRPRARCHERRYFWPADGARKSRGLPRGNRSPVFQDSTCQGKKHGVFEILEDSNSNRSLPNGILTMRVSATEPCSLI